MKKFFLFAIFVFLSFSLNAKQPMKVIFDTDMGNDVDDVIALDMLYKYVDEGTIDLLGIISSKRELGSVKFIDAMSMAYGHPEIPLGIVKTYPHEKYKCADKRLNYADYVVKNHNYAHILDDYEALTDGYKLLRKLLAENTDVTIIAVGFSTNLSRLLTSKGDEISPLTGEELVKNSVKKMVMMAGNFHQVKKEYNIYNDPHAATIVLQTWPTPIYFTDFSLGRVVFYPYTSFDSFNYVRVHPGVEAFKYYNKMPYNRPMWDATAVLFAVEPSSKYFSLSPKGYVTVDEGSVTYFYKDRKSNRRYYEANDKQKMAIVRRMVELTTRKPRKSSQIISVS